MQDRFMRFIRIATDLAEKVCVWTVKLLQVSVTNADIRAGLNKPDDFYKIPKVLPQPNL